MTYCEDHSKTGTLPYIGEGEGVSKIDYKNSWYQTFKPEYKIFDEGLTDYWEMHYMDRWRTALKYLPQEKMIDAKVLDIGCGLGRAMMWFTRFGAKCVGIEPSEYACEVAKSRGMKVLNGYFEEIIDINETFDVIHIEQVLSHAPRYKDILNKARHLLSDDGVLIIEEPNDFNPLQMKLKDRLGEYWVTDDHCNYFNYEMMAGALADAGFEVLEKTCTYPVEFYEFAGDRYVGHEEVGKQVHRKKTDLLLAMGVKLREKVLKGYADMGVGRDLIMFARKGVGTEYSIEI